MWQQAQTIDFQNKSSCKVNIQGNITIPLKSEQQKNRKKINPLHLWPRGMSENLMLITR
jgi:hypothetical protein